MPYKFRLVIPLFISLISFFAVLVYARSTGITGRTKLSGGAGCSCHRADPTAAVIVTLNGPKELETGQTADYSLTIEGGPLASAGTNIAASAGALTPVDNSLHLLSGELTHTSPKKPSGNRVTFNFEFTAPEIAGTVNIEAAGNSVNLDHTNTGDFWNHAEGLVLSVKAPTGISEFDISALESFTLDQNFPNPFNPETTIRYSIKKAGNIDLSVYNLLGQKIQNLVNHWQETGRYQVQFNGDHLESGTYIYNLTVGGKSKVKKMLLLK